MKCTERKKNKLCVYSLVSFGCLLAETQILYAILQTSTRWQTFLSFPEILVKLTVVQQIYTDDSIYPRAAATNRIGC